MQQPLEPRLSIFTLQAFLGHFEAGIRKLVVPSLQTPSWTVGVLMVCVTVQQLQNC